MKYLLLLQLLVWTLPVFGGNGPEHELVSILKVDESLRAIVKIQAEVVMTANPKFKDFDRLMTKWFDEADLGGQFKEVMAGSYAENLEKEDLESIVAFFKSGAGKKYIEVQPIIQEKMKFVSEKIRQKNPPPIQDILRLPVKSEGPEYVLVKILNIEEKYRASMLDLVQVSKDANPDLDGIKKGVLELYKTNNLGMRIEEAVAEIYRNNISEKDIASIIEYFEGSAWKTFSSIESKIDSEMNVAIEQVLTKNEPSFDEIMKNHFTKPSTQN